MREILFRGKRTDNGEWVEGFYCQFHNRPITNEENSHQIFVAMENAVPFGSMIGGLWYEVISDTVGQYTGLTDKNGTKIFEGDIVHCKSRSDSADMVVIYENGQFRLILLERYNSYQPNMGYYDINCFTKTVIGNIHDNPEIMKGGAE